jgi:hypothetical protein
MDGSPNSGRFHATTLWHIDAVEWAPSTSSKADISAVRFDVRLVPTADVSPARKQRHDVPIGGVFQSLGSEELSRFDQLGTDTIGVRHFAARLK